MRKGGSQRVRAARKSSMPVSPATDELWSPISVDDSQRHSRLVEPAAPEALFPETPVHPSNCSHPVQNLTDNLMLSNVAMGQKPVCIKAFCGQKSLPISQPGKQNVVEVLLLMRKLNCSLASRCAGSSPLSSFSESQVPTFAELSLTFCGRLGGAPKQTTAV